MVFCAAAHQGKNVTFAKRSRTSPLIGGVLLPAIESGSNDVDVILNFYEETKRISVWW